MVSCAAVYDGSDLVFYVNGQETDRQSAGANASSTKHLVIGEDGWGNLFHGAVDEFRIHGRALLADEIAASYDVGANPLSRRFENLTNATYSYYAYVTNQSGDSAKTETRSVTIASTSDPCDGVTCSGHGDCVVTDGQASCDCEEGYHAVGLDCEEDQTTTGVSTTPLQPGDRLPVIMFMINMRGATSMATYKRVIDLCAANHFTHVMLSFWLTHIKCPTLVNDGRFRFNDAALTMAQVQELVDYIDQKGMKPVPGMRLLTHQDDRWNNLTGGVGASFPPSHEFMANKTTSNPESAELNSLLYGCIDDMLPRFIVNGRKPDYFLIGHDELAGHWPYYNDTWLTCDTYQGGYSPCIGGTGCEHIVTAEEFEDSILGLREHVTQGYGIRIMMFPDSLIQHAELGPNASRFAGHAGCEEGPGNELVQLRHRLPRDIYMMEWASGSVGFDILQDDEGFDVLFNAWPKEGAEGAMRSMVDYMLAHGHDHCGIQVTEWNDISSHMDEVAHIIQVTGDYAWNTVKQ